MSENLSKILFTQKRHVQETSAIIANSSTKKNLKLNDVIKEGESRDGWYRLLKFLLWSWQGIEAIDCYDVLSKISSSKNPRSETDILDSVIGFRSGNWAYEWTQKGMYYQKKAKEFVEEGNNSRAQKAFYSASQFYSVASYPHLRGDELSIQAQLLAFQNYRESFKYASKSLLKEIKVPFQGKQIICYLHLPHTEHIHPLVIVSGGIDMLQCEMYSLFENDLAPAGIAMLTVDIPGVGFSSQVKLTEDASQLHQAIIHYMQHVPWVDQARISLMGMRFGGNIATRLAFLEPKSIKSVVSVGATVSSIFDDKDKFKALPPVLLDCFASRLQVNNSDVAQLYPLCMPFSLVKQGLLARKRIETPFLSIGHKHDMLCDEKDLIAIARASWEGESQIHDKPPIFTSYLHSLRYSAQWLTRHLLE
ncbi:fermentation/respiration switch protein [Psychromonas sp. CNPT3]|uniref:esterase FrsA n=1 Tax=Psychromonas sp. CNPT3 TaxID=314282 RepID=UPI00006E584E|nr:esterase FrsA [Psychromonas sp. CNPT3]AGH81967.1 fermentation/respiration switch protein [Psychromonas sp. CNPT3]